MFDPQPIAEQLRLLNPTSRSIFCAACAQRLLPNYDAFTYVEKWGNAVRLRGILENVWQSLLSPPLSDVRVEELMHMCETLGPDADDFTSFYVTLAGRAVEAVYHTLSCALTGSTADAGYVSEAALESVDAYLHAVNNPIVGPGAFTTAFDDWVSHCPLMQAEINKQLSDIAALGADATPTPSLIEKIRASSFNTGLQPVARGLVKPRN